MASPGLIIPVRNSLFVCSLVVLTFLPIVPVSSEEVDIQRLFEQARQEERVGLARKTRAVDVRPAREGEIVVTIIAGEGKETQSSPAKHGDKVVRNRCPETGNEEILVSKEKFAERYDGPSGPSPTEGWQEFRPRGNDMHYFIVRETDGSFSFLAPWDEPMVARPGDAIVSDANDPSDTYRIAAAAFACTYDIVQPATN